MIVDASVFFRCEAVRMEEIEADVFDGKALMLQKGHDIPPND